jgi:hypothetical protein
MASSVLLVLSAKRKTNRKTTEKEKSGMAEDQSKTRYYRSLLRNVVLSILFTAMTPTVIVSLFILDEFRTSYEKRVHDHLALLVKKHKRSMDMFLEEKLMDIRMLAGANLYAELSDEPTLNRNFDEMQRAFDRTFVDLGVVNHNGRQIAYAGPHGLTGVSYLETDWFKQAISSPYFVSDVFKGLRGEPHFIVTVRNVHEGKPWILRATIDFGEFNDLLEEIVYLSSQRAKYGNIGLHTDFESDLPMISASETEMQQVFFNLVNNALDAMEKTGGELTLRSRQVEDDIEVTVADTGIGIADANLKRIFDPFYTTKPVGKGTGLGLSICFGIINKIGGEIKAQSEMGEGTTFTI